MVLYRVFFTLILFYLFFMEKIEAPYIGNKKIEKMELYFSYCDMQSTRNVHNYFLNFLSGEKNFKINETVYDEDCVYETQIKKIEDDQGIGYIVRREAYGQSLQMEIYTEDSVHTFYFDEGEIFDPEVIERIQEYFGDDFFRLV